MDEREELARLGNRMASLEARFKAFTAETRTAIDELRGSVHSIKDREGVTADILTKMSAQIEMLLELMRPAQPTFGELAKQQRPTAAFMAVAVAIIQLLQYLS